METVEKSVRRFQHPKNTFGKPMEKQTLFRKFSIVFLPLSKPDRG